MDLQAIKKSPLCLSLSEPAIVIKFSPYEWSMSLLAIGHDSTIEVYSIELKDEPDNVSFKLIWECHIQNEPVCIAWSPVSTLRAIDKCLQLLVATTSYSVIQLESDLMDNNLLKNVCDHRDNINSIAYSSDSNRNLLAASTGDDLVAKIWQCSTNKLISKFSLTSPGMFVQFHPEDNDIVLVAEKCGTVRVYSILKNCAKITLRTSAILSADWCISDPSVLVASGPQGVTYWNLEDQHPQKKEIQMGSGECILKIASSPSNERVIATLGASKNIKVSSLTSNKSPLTMQMKVVSDVSWHLKSQVLAVASDRNILFWETGTITL